MATPASLRGLRTFCIAARYENFRAAGEALFLTPSAVSHQIRSLEEELGFELFDRGGSGLTLTEKGRSLYQEIGPMIAGIDEVAARYRSSAPRKTVRISVQPFFASEVFVGRLKRFTSAHPEIELQVNASDESAERHPADADLSIRLFRSPPAENSQRLFALKVAAAGSKAFRRRMVVRKKVITSDFPRIVHQTFPDLWADWSRFTGIQLPENSKITRLDSMIAVVRAAERGIGAALVPVPVSEQWFRQETIVRLFDQVMETDAGYHLVWKAAALDEPGVRALQRWILAEFSE